MNKQINIIRSLALAALIAAGAAAPAVNASAQINIDNVGVRTNALTWAMLSPSLGVDMQFNNRWQAGIDGNISPMEATNGMAMISGAGVEVRRYFNESYSGFYTGATTRYLDYNDRMLHDTPRDGKMITIGVLGGYSFKLKGPWSLDTSLGLGYVHDDYTEYKWYAPKTINRMIAKNVVNRFGITSAEVSFVYSFNISGKHALKH